MCMNGEREKEPFHFAIQNHINCHIIYLTLKFCLFLVTLFFATQCSYLYLAVLYRIAHTEGKNRCEGEKKVEAKMKNFRQAEYGTQLREQINFLSIDEYKKFTTLTYPHAHIHRCA